jgi:hypothetical protein
MPVLVLLLLFFSPGRPEADTLHLRISAAPEVSGTLPDMPSLEAGITRLFAAEFGIFTSLEFDADSAPSADPSARILLGVSGGAITVSTDYTRARSTRSLVTTVQEGSPAALVAAVVGDLAFLSFSARGFSTLPLSPPPQLVAALSMDTLGTLTGWNPEELEPIGLSGSGDEITICFPHRYLTLGPLFRISASTIRDINGQSTGREPMQLSGIVARPDGRLLLLSEHDGRIAMVDPRLGTRQVTDAPGLSALPARLAGRDTLAALPGKLGETGVVLYPVQGGPPRAVRIAASYVPAFDLDREGNIWAWDAGERRVRVLTPRGREVFSVRPLFSAATMQLPQALAVFDDGSFLLGGSGEVWKFQSSGIPVWRLSRIPGRPGESLPSSFDLAPNRSDGSFTLLDAQSRRLLSFSPSPVGDSVRLGTLLGKLDSRKQADLQDVSSCAKDSALGLMALQFGALLAGAGGADTLRQAARIELLKEKAAAFADYADALTRDLLYERADAAWLRTAESLRELTAESAEDEEAAGMLQIVLARRREIRAALAASPDVQVVTARVLIGQSNACSAALTLEITLRNAGARAMRGVRVHAGIPSADLAPALAALDEIPPSEMAQVRVPFGSADWAAHARSVSAYMLVTYETGQDGFSRALTFSAQPVQETRSQSLAESLACRAVSADTLASSLEESLLTGARANPPQPLAGLAGILSSLGAGRRLAGMVTAAAGPSSPSQEETLRPGMRNLLRSLSGDESAWTTVMASIASSLGMPAAILSIGARPFALVDTGLPFSEALAQVDGLSRFRDRLAVLSSGGTLWVPLSGRVAPEGVDAASWSFADALAALAGDDSANTHRAAIPQSSGQQNAPMPFPLVLPVVAVRSSATALRSDAAASLAGVP